MRDFYQHQDNAFRRTARLMFVLSVAIIGTVVCTAAALTYGIIVLLYLGAHFDLHDFTLEIFELFCALSIVTLGVVGVASWSKMRQLRAGGKVIAIDLGGELIEDDGSLSDKQRRLLNIVQEMAVAASIPPPAVYELPGESGINAFAAGFTFDDAVLGVTRGCMTRLNRDQLQGVIAHEFGHILNGDMSLNLKLVGVLHGILMIPITAEAAIRTGYEIATDGSDASDAGNDLVTAFVLMMFGLLLWPIGLAGSLFGMLTMSATSRQREYLADAFAVQFTRNPTGISDALKVLAGHHAGSRVRTKNSMEASHFFFAPGVKTALFATHPPLQERILRLDPSWDGIPMYESEEDLGNYQGAYENSYALVGQAAAAGFSAQLGGEPREDCPPDGVAPVTHESGQDDLSESERPFCQSDWTRRYYEELLTQMPQAWIDLVQDASGAQAMLTSLWIAHLQDRESGFAAASPSLAQYTVGLTEHVGGLSEAEQSLLMDLALDTIHDADPDSKRDFLHHLPNLLAKADTDNLTHWSWVRQIRARTQVEEEPRAIHGTLQPVVDACEVYLSWLCHAGSDNAVMAEYAFQRAVVHLGLKNPAIRERDSLTIEMLDVSIDMLAETAARCRRQLLVAMGACVAADRDITNDEAMLVRGACAALRLPVPALLPGQAVAPGV